MRCLPTICAMRRCGRSFICRWAARRLRVHLSNAFGTQALHFTSVHVAHAISPKAAAIDPASDHALTFAGKPDVTIPPGAEYVSDPLEIPVAPLSDIAVSFHLDEPPEPETGHPGSRSTSYYEHGDAVSATDLPDAKHVDHWYQLTGIDVETAPEAGTVVALGDSITDGHAATTNGNDRWPDVLAARLQAEKRRAMLACRTRESAAIICLLTGWGRMCWRGSIATCWRRPACAG